MIFIGMITFPPESANEIGKRYLELPSLPDYMTMKGLYIPGMIKGGIQGFDFC
jgi:hypothetical protein